MSKPKALVLCGDGINCEEETAYALELSDFEPTLLHVFRLLEEPKLLKQFSMLVLPGGFSFGDEIASGKVLAIKLKEKLFEPLHKFIASGQLVLGICNGFQVLVQMQILPEIQGSKIKQASLVHNHQGKFINRWVELIVERKNQSRFFAELTEIQLPMRHGEGRLTVDPSCEVAIKQGICLRYKDDVNGSFERIAALSNSQGNVLGIMPHPEAFVRWTQNPAWTANKELLSSSGSPHGLKIWRNARQSLA